MRSVMSSLKLACGACVLCCISMTGTASAEPATPDKGEDAKSKLLYEKGGLAGIGLSLGAKLGGGFGQPFNELKTSMVAEFEAGYALPFLNRSLSVYASGQYNAPSSKQTSLTDTFGPGGDSSRVPADWGYTLTQQQAIVGLGLLYRIPLSIPMFRPYVAAGGRYYMMRTTIKGSVADKDGALPFGSNDETATAFGFYGALGGELYLGPGAVLLEVQTGQASVNQYILRDTNISTLNVALGYRVFL